MTWRSCKPKLFQNVAGIAHIENTHLISSEIGNGHLNRKLISHFLLEISHSSIPIRHQLIRFVLNIHCLARELQRLLPVVQLLRDNRWCYLGELFIDILMS
ncbi:hypothetical protein D3C76_1524090 [compost metagenome]